MRFDPADPNAWVREIQTHLQISPAQGQRLLETGQLPTDRVLHWFRTQLAGEFSPEFVPALTRNLNGMLAWLHANGDEPYWPGDDGAQPGGGPRADERT